MRERVVRQTRLYPSVREIGPPHTSRVGCKGDARMTKFTYNAHRILAGVWLIEGLFSIANYYFELGLLGRGGKGILILNVCLFAVYGAFFAPTREERQKHK